MRDNTLPPRVYSLHRSHDETGVVTNRGIWWAKKEIVKVRVAENYLSLIPVRHHPSFVVTTVRTVHDKREILILLSLDLPRTKMGWLTNENTPEGHMAR